MKTKNRVVISIRTMKIEVFTNDGVLAGLKIHHFRGLTVPDFLDLENLRKFSKRPTKVIKAKSKAKQF